MKLFSILLLCTDSFGKACLSLQIDWKKDDVVTCVKRSELYCPENLIHTSFAWAACDKPIVIPHRSRRWHWRPIFMTVISPVSNTGYRYRACIYGDDRRPTDAWRQLKQNVLQRGRHLKWMRSSSPPGGIERKCLCVFITHKHRVRRYLSRCVPPGWHRCWIAVYIADCDTTHPYNMATMSTKKRLTSILLVLLFTASGTEGRAMVSFVSFWSCACTRNINVA